MANKLGERRLVITIGGKNAYPNMKIRPNFELFKQQRGISVVFN